MIKPPTAKQVESLRRRADMTAEAFGQLVYVEPATVYAWEKGRRQCPASAWELLLVYFGKAEPRRLYSALNPQGERVLLPEGTYFGKDGTLKEKEL